jgi:outer membrane protein
MTRTFVRLLLLLAVVFSLAAFAQTKPAPATAAAPAPAAPAGPAKVGIVNIQAAIVSTNEGQRDFQVLQGKFAPKRTELENLNREVEDLKKQLSTTGDKLNADARENLLKQIDNKQKTLQRNYEDANNDLQAQQNEIGNRIGQKMMEVLDKYAKENGYTLILDYSGQSSSVLWAATSVDVTQQLIEAYNVASGVPAQPGSPAAPGAATPKAPTKPAK